MYNQYQKMHYEALYTQNKRVKPKQYALYEGNNLVMVADYPLLVNKKKQLIQQGCREYLLKIKEYVQTRR